MFFAAIQVGLLQTSFIQNWVENRFTGLNVKYVLALIPISLISLITVINSSVLTAKGKFKAHFSLPFFISSSILLALVTAPKEYMFEALLLGTLFGRFLELVVSGSYLSDVFLRFHYNLIKETSIGFKKIVTSMPPMVMSGVIMNGCLIIDPIMATLAGDGSVAMIQFGSVVPLGFITIISVFWTVLYSNFVKLAAMNDYTSLKRSLWRFCGIGIVALFPLCGSFAYFSEHIITIFFERGAFLASDTVIVSNIQTLYLLHIPLFVLCMVCIRLINALENTQMLLWGNILSLLLNIGLNFYFITLYGVIGVPLATLTTYSLMVLYWFFTTNWLINIRI